MKDQTSFETRAPEPISPGPSGSGLIRGFLGAAKAVLLSPRTFFPDMPVVGGLLGPYFFFLLCTVFSFITTLVLNMTTSGTFDPRVLWMFALALLTPFLSAALLQFFLTALRGANGSYEATFRVVCYASAVNLVAWIPVAGVILILQFYKVYLSVLGLSVVHRITMGRAFMAVVGTALALVFTVFLAAQTMLSP